MEQVNEIILVKVTYSILKSSVEIMKNTVFNGIQDILVGKKESELE